MPILLLHIRTCHTPDAKTHPLTAPRPRPSALSPLRVCPRRRQHVARIEGALNQRKKKNKKRKASGTGRPHHAIHMREERNPVIVHTTSSREKRPGCTSSALQHDACPRQLRAPTPSFTLAPPSRPLHMTGHTEKKNVAAGERCSRGKKKRVARSAAQGESKKDAQAHIRTPL